MPSPGESWRNRLAYTIFTAERQLKAGEDGNYIKRLIGLPDDEIDPPQGQLPTLLREHVF